MTGTFHWIRVRLFCYSTENHERLEEILTELTGTSEFTKEITEGHHGNPITILDCELTREKDAERLFGNIRPVLDDILEGLEDKIDDDCVFYMRLDKQKAVLNEYAIAHHGDVISITGKLVSHPARKNIAAENMRSFLNGI